jgi:ubiquinone/menaquinone biosynthesis C-methylase UbiE
MTNEPNPPLLEYRCPRCKGALASTPDAYACLSCGRDYPIVWGIPDFRLFPDPYISIEDDHRKALRIAERYDASDARRLMEFYWSITPDTPPELWRRYMRFDLAGEERGRQWLADLEEQLGRPALNPTDTVLELGCRTGGTLAALAQRTPQGRAVGIDIAFRWLIVTKKRLEQQGLRAQFACCCAQYLPFQNDQFNLIIAGNILEHSPRDQSLIPVEAHRTLRPGGLFSTVTVNRFSLAREPHVNLWGVGFLPRKWMDSYVRRRIAVPYENVRLLSFFDLRRMMHPFASRRIAPPKITPPQDASRPLAIALKLYNRLRTWPLVRQFLLLFAPLLEAIGQKAESQTLNPKP